MTGLLPSLMVGIYCCFIPFLDIWVMGRGFLLIVAVGLMSGPLHPFTPGA